MGRKSMLTNEEQGQIKAFHDIGLSNREIGRRLGRDHGVIARYLADPEGYGTHKSSGRPQALSERAKRVILNKASNSTKGCRRLQRECAPLVSKSTVWNLLHKSQNLRHMRMTSAPALKATHIQARSNFADKHQTWTHEWDKIIWSDEKKFSLDGPDGLSSYWHDLRKEPRFFSKRNFGGGSVMIWGSFSAFGKSSIAFIGTRLDSIGYQKVLQEHLIPFMNKYPSANQIFMQDNAAIHASRSTANWLASKNIRVLEWPARSPDLNPIENLWCIIVRDIYADNRQYETVSELKIAIESAWNRINEQTLKNLINSMPKRINLLIKSGGNPIKY
uniref:Uncharacterized protein n=1 Tax=Meloidogyne enterolobii TaxID=390850 RepID=A0A6V7XW04_MELEN|nr:unnamed protein product [Meloidogyne enterolobii]